LAAWAWQTDRANPENTFLKLMLSLPINCRHDQSSVIMKNKRKDYDADLFRKENKVEDIDDWRPFQATAIDKI
jgi:hypothetical protein